MMKAIRSGIRELDEYFGGGIPSGCVTEICGAHCTWKSSLCYRLIRTSLADANTQEAATRCILVDTQRDVTRALSAIEEHSFVHSITVAPPMEKIEELTAYLEEEEKRYEGATPAQLVIIDSLPSLCEHFHSPLEQSIQLHRLNLYLQRHAHQYQAAVVVVNYLLSGVPRNLSLGPARAHNTRMLGRAWASAPTIILLVSRPRGAFVNAMQITILKGDPHTCTAASSAPERVFTWRGERESYGQG